MIACVPDPVNSMLSLDDGEKEMAVVTDVSMGGTSMADGQLEIMVHRRCQHDDHRGVQEPLNEVRCKDHDVCIPVSTVDLRSLPDVDFYLL